MKPLKIFDNKFTVEKDEKGLLKYTANIDAIFKAYIRKPLTKKEHQKPAFQVIIEIESNAKKSASEYFENLTLDLVKTLKNL